MFVYTPVNGTNNQLIEWNLEYNIFAEIERESCLIFLFL